MMRAPLKYVQGKGALLHFHKEMGYMGKRWLFVCSNSGYKSCYEDLEKSFKGTQDYRRYEVFGGISSVNEVKKMQKIVESDNIDVVVAVGGGSAVDTAKASAYYSGRKIVIIPTVAATDAPCTGLSVIYNDDGSFHCRSITGGDIDSYCSHVDADSYTWIQNSDMIDLEFNTDNPHKKVTFYAQILNNGDKIRCSDMFEISEESLTFIKQDKMPKLTSIEEDSDKLIGEWELVAYGDYSPHDMTSDEGTEFGSTLNIYKKNDKMYADYHFIREKGSGKSDIEQMGISFNKKPLTLNCLNEFWSASFNEAVIPEGADQKIKLNVNFTLVGDNKLLLIEEDPESDFDGYPTLVYLRKGTKEYDDRENYFYHQVVTVSDINELVQNLYANTKIILKEGTYNFSNLDSDTSIDEYGESDSGSNYFNYLLYTDHIRLEAEDGAKVSILTNSSTSNVLEFFGGNDISFKGLTFGHNVEKGFCTGNVLAFSSCDGIRIEDCNLFGCGTYGISSNGVSNLSVINTQIYECSYGLLELNNTYDSTFKNCVLRDSEGYNQFEMNYCGNISFEDCQI